MDTITLEKLQTIINELKEDSIRTKRGIAKKFGFDPELVEEDTIFIMRGEPDMQKYMPKYIHLSPYLPKEVCYMSKESDWMFPLGGMV